MNLSSEIGHRDTAMEDKFSDKNDQIFKHVDKRKGGVESILPFSSNMRKAFRTEVQWQRCCQNGVCVTKDEPHICAILAAISMLRSFLFAESAKTVYEGSILLNDYKV